MKNVFTTVLALVLVASVPTHLKGAPQGASIEPMTAKQVRTAEANAACHGVCRVHGCGVYALTRGQCNGLPVRFSTTQPRPRERGEGDQNAQTPEERHGGARRRLGRGRGKEICQEQTHQDAAPRPHDDDLAPMPAANAHAAGLTAPRSRAARRSECPC